MAEHSTWGGGGRGRVMKETFCCWGGGEVEGGTLVGKGRGKTSQKSIWEGHFVGGMWVGCGGTWKALPGLCCRSLLSASAMISVRKETDEDDL